MIVDLYISYSEIDGMFGAICSFIIIYQNLKYGIEKEDLILEMDMILRSL